LTGAQLAAATTGGEVAAAMTGGEVVAKANVTGGEVSAKVTMTGGEVSAKATGGEVASATTSGEVVAKATVTGGEVSAKATDAQVSAKATGAQVAAATTGGELVAKATLGEVAAKATGAEVAAAMTLPAKVTRSKAAGKKRIAVDEDAMRKKPKSVGARIGFARMPVYRALRIFYVQVSYIPGSRCTSFILSDVRYTGQTGLTAGVFFLASKYVAYIEVYEEFGFQAQVCLQRLNKTHGVKSNRVASRQAAILECLSSF
jgi:hypothetical protein